MMSQKSKYNVFDKINLLHAIQRWLILYRHQSHFLLL